MSQQDTTTAGPVAASERVTAIEPFAPGAPATAADCDDFAGAPESFGRFVVLRPLGSGAMGKVYSAYDQKLDRKVAIKVGHSDARTRPDHDQRLAREAQALARLSHPNVVQLYESGECESGKFLVMELLPGVSLRTWVSAASRSWREVLAVFAAAGRGLAAAHAEGVVHRDFKPDNVIVGPDGRVRLVDFGLACAGGELRPFAANDALVETISEGSALGLRFTVEGTLLGTPAYMSPEQYGGGSIDERSDQFSFCAALYEGLYGRRPFAGATAMAIEEEVSKGAIRPPPADTAVPTAVHRVIVRGLQPRPEDRWSSMEELLAALSAAQEPPRRRWLARAALAVGVAGVLLAAGLNLAGAGESYAERACPRSAADSLRPESLASR